MEEQVMKIVQEVFHKESAELQEATVKHITGPGYGGSIMEEPEDAIYLNLGF